MQSIGGPGAFCGRSRQDQAATPVTNGCPRMPPCAETSRPAMGPSGPDISRPRLLLIVRSWPLSPEVVSLVMARAQHKYRGYLIPYARRLRGTTTLPERFLWAHVRRHALGTRFLRQCPVGKYIVDFLAPELRLVLEIDGESHRDREKEDMERHAAIEAQGLYVVRFTNDDVLQSPTETFGRLRDIVVCRAAEVGVTLGPRARRPRE